MKNIFLKLIFISIVSISCAFAQESLKETFTKSEQKLELKKSLRESNPYNLIQIKRLVSLDKNEIQDDTRIKKIEEEIKKITFAILNQKKVFIDDVNYEKELNFLKSKININSRQDNQLAVQRDELKKEILINKHILLNRIKEIINGINSFKDKKYFVNLLNYEIKRISSYDLNKYRKTNDLLDNNTSEVASAFKNEYKIFSTQIKSHMLVYEYLLNNMSEYRQSNILLDELSSEYLISTINKLPGLSLITEIADYYLGISMGEVIVVFFILGIFYIFNKKALPYFNTILKNKLIKRHPVYGLSIFEYIKESSYTPFRIIIYILAAQLSLSILLENVLIFNKTIPWFRTAYLGLFTYILYGLLKNAVHLFADNLFDKYPNVRKEMIDFLLRIAKVIVFMFVLLFLFMQLGFDIQAILASLGIGGIAVALAAKDTLTNFFGSLSIIADSSFSQGDWIEAGNVEGTVVDIRMRTTRIRTFSNAMITIPNAQLANLPITNWSKRKIGRRIKMSIGMTYSSKMSDIKNLVKDIKEMLENHDGIATSKIKIHSKKNSNLLKKEDLDGIKKTLLVFIDEFDNSSINVLVYCFSKSPVWEEWLEVKEDVIVKIDSLVKKNNCSFAFPSQSIYIENKD